ncbi:neo-calmodulin [Eurytemora carolleeae]|uniref:neo-calmodulin n=1 Tax=Eurytemora carolleeae TaxID=1294199 RepID=UPI000C78D829|nr:neo-calmodulin [Eurytemora carolleeae]|eukprot:XP_023347175.1 neo-calmodulin-like [Eurytemora affinis]
MEAVTLTDSQLKKFKAVFNRFDEDEDGVVSCKEVGKILRNLGYNPSDAELQEMIRLADKDGSGALDFPEFLNMMKERIKEQNEDDDIKNAFKLFDTDGNGYIDRKELRVMMRFIGEPVTEDEIENILEEADTDKNGLIDYTEFFALMAPSRS